MQTDTDFDTENVIEEQNVKDKLSKLFLGFLELDH